MDLPNNHYVTLQLHNLLPKQTERGQRLFTIQTYIDKVLHQGGAIHNGMYE